MTDQPTEEYDVTAGFAAEDELEPEPEPGSKPKRRRRRKPTVTPAPAPKLHVNWLSATHNARHPDVKVWQQQLRARGLELEPTGVFDLQTEQATRQFQQAAVGTDDGVVGPLIWASAWEPL